MRSIPLLAALALLVPGCFGGGSVSRCVGEDAVTIFLRPDAPREDIRAAFVEDGWTVDDSEVAPWYFDATKRWNESVNLSASVSRSSGYSGTPDNRTNEVDNVAIALRLTETRPTGATPVTRIEDVEGPLLAKLRAMGLAEDATAGRPPTTPTNQGWECIHGD